MECGAGGPPRIGTAVSYGEISLGLRSTWCWSEPSRAGTAPGATGTYCQYTDGQAPPPPRHQCNVSFRRLLWNSARPLHPETLFLFQPQPSSTTTPTPASINTAASSVSLSAKSSLLPTTTTESVRNPVSFPLALHIFTYPRPSTARPGPRPPTTTIYHENLRDPSVHGPPAHHSGAMALFVDILRPPRARAGPRPSAAPPPFSPARCIHSPWLQQLRPAFQVTAAAAARAKSRQQPGRPPTAAGRPGDAPSLAGRRGSGSPPPLSPMASPPEKDAMWPAWKPRSPWAARVHPPNVR